MVNGLTPSEQTAINRRAELKAVAKERGRGFSRLEAQRFLGGSVLVF